MRQEQPLVATKLTETLVYPISHNPAKVQISRQNVRVTDDPMASYTSGELHVLHWHTLNTRSHPPNKKISVNVLK